LEDCFIPYRDSKEKSNLPKPDKGDRLVSYSCPNSNNVHSEINGSNKLLGVESTFLKPTGNFTAF